MLFKTYTPAAVLAPHIRSFWTLEMDEVPQKQELILPDGCMELIFHYGDAYCTNIRDINEPQPYNIVIGQIEKAIELKPTGRTGIISARFHPWGFYTLTGIPADKLRNNYLPASDVFGNAVEELAQQLSIAAHEDKVLLLTDFLTHRLAIRKEDYYKKETTYIQALQELEKENGNIPVAEMAERCNVSVRQFSRTISKLIGLPPKHYARILRLHAFLNNYNTDRSQSLTNALYAAGYYDQAHFIKEFRDISSYAPSEFFKGNNEMAELMLL